MNGQAQSTALIIRDKRWWMAASLMLAVLALLLWAFSMQARAQDDLEPLGQGSHTAQVQSVVGIPWEKTVVTYHFVNCPSKIDCATAQDAVRQALGMWDAASGLSLVEVSGTADIEIKWTTGNFAGSYSFDGPGGILAYGGLPLSYRPWCGDLFFDDDENWAVGSSFSPFPQQVDLTMAALHEGGHALGLYHSSSPGAVMGPRYEAGRRLTESDIAAIQALYGPPSADEAQGTGEAVGAALVANSTPVTTTAVRMRSGPGASYNALTTIPSGTPVQVLSKDGDWLQVTYNGMTGWVAGWLVSY